MLDEITAARFWSKVDKRGPDECWPWTGALYEGYGRFAAKGVSKKAHRWSAIIAGQAVADSNPVDHMCRNRACVNPAHLRPVSWRENAIENSVAVTAINASKSFCSRGHPLEGPHIRIKVKRDGVERVCRLCHAENCRASRRRAKAALAKGSSHGG